MVPLFPTCGLQALLNLLCYYVKGVVERDVIDIPTTAKIVRVMDTIDDDHLIRATKCAKNLFFLSIIRMNKFEIFTIKF